MIPSSQTTGLAIIRIILGVFMIYHGWEVFDAEKMNGYLTWDQFKNGPAMMVYAGKIAELLGGLLLAVGFLTRTAAIIIAITMLYVSFFCGTWQDLVRGPAPVFICAAGAGVLFYRRW